MGSDKVIMIKTSPHEAGARFAVCGKLIVKNKTGRPENKVIVVVVVVVVVAVVESYCDRSRLDAVLIFCINRAPAWAPA